MQIKKSCRVSIIKKLLCEQSILLWHLQPGSSALRCQKLHHELRQVSAANKNLLRNNNAPRAKNKSFSRANCTEKAPDKRIESTEEVLESH